jgi:hypothetical protein
MAASCAATERAARALKDIPVFVDAFFASAKMP